jgi:hypothetical protein
MIKFFRKIRQNLLEQNKIGSYLKYAIGEIFLVVIGILIALQINNANEAHKAKRSEQIVLKNLIQDLRADSLSFSDNLAILSKVSNLHQALYEIGVNGQDMELENPNLIRFSIYYSPVAIKNDPVIAGKVSNEIIRKEILTYSAYLLDLDLTYSEYSDLLENRIRVFLGDKKVHRLSGYFGNQENSVKGAVPLNFVDKAGLILVSKTPEFQQLLLEASIKTKNTGAIMEKVLTQNHKLKEAIIKELEK